VVQDTESYQKLIELAERAERIDALRSTIRDLRNGNVSEAEDILAEMQEILAKKSRR
jgi:hypothetical protein